MNEDCRAPVFGPSSGLACAFKSLILAVALVLVWVAWLLVRSAWLHCLWRAIAFRMKHCREGNKDKDILLLNITEWLIYKPGIRAHMVFEEADGGRAYSDWSAAERKMLRIAYDAIAASRDTGLPVEPEVTIPTPDTVSRQGFEPTLAKRIFIAIVAASLYHEREGDAAWSLDDGNAHPDALLDSRSVFRLRDSGRYENHFAEVGRITPGDPGRIRRFLETEDLIGPSRVETITRLFTWCRANLQHYFGADTSDNYEDHWQYPGFPPVERVIEGTILAPTGTFNHYTAGCWGTTGFLNMVLRTVNIPVRLDPRCGHALPVFPSEARFLTHGDDLYGVIPRWTLPSEALLIDLARLEPLFGTPDCAPNVGRGPREAAIEHLPIELLRIHCDDLNEGRGHEESRVFELVGRHTTVQALEQEGLWDRLDQAVADAGGCDAL